MIIEFIASPIFSAQNDQAFYFNRKAQAHGFCYMIHKTKSDVNY